MTTSPDDLRATANQLRHEADELDDAAATLEHALQILDRHPSQSKLKSRNPLKLGIGTPTLPVGSVIVPWGKQASEIDPEFMDGLRWIYEQIKLSPALLVPCMKFESNLDPKARNPHSSASGLIQFMSSTAIMLGTTIEKIRAMSAMEQLGLVYKYFHKFGDDLSHWTLCDCYLAILWPTGIGKPLNAPIFVRGKSTYRVNAGLDTDKDGVITKHEICAKLQGVSSEGLKNENMLSMNL